MIFPWTWELTLRQSIFYTGKEKHIGPTTFETNTMLVIQHPLLEAWGALKIFFCLPIISNVLKWAQIGQFQHKMVHFCSLLAHFLHFCPSEFFLVCSFYPFKKCLMLWPPATGCKSVTMLFCKDLVKSTYGIRIIPFEMWKHGMHNLHTQDTYVIFDPTSFQQSNSLATIIVIRFIYNNLS